MYRDRSPWACEEKPPEFWTDENLETSVGELLCQMIEWLIERRCPSYFIRKNNMIDHLPMYNDLSNEISSLLHYKEQCIPALLSNTPKAYPRTEFHVKVPNRALHHVYTHMIFSNIVNPLEPRMVGRLMKELTTSMDFMPVLKTLHSGITQHLKLMIYRNGRTLETTEECELLSSALNSFALAIEASDHGHSRASMSLSDSLITNAENLTLPTFINKQRNSTDSIQLNGVHGFELEEEEEDRLHVKDLKLHILRTVLETIMQNLADSLTIPSFFISAAYRANFLYTGLRHYHLALRQCDEACNLLDAQEKDVVKDITRPVFCFMVTNEWSVMFDENVQTVLGFTALYRFVFNACNQGPKRLVGAARIGSTIVVRLCAMKFLCYIRRRCLRLLGKPWTVWTPFAPCNLDRLPKQPMFSENYIDLFSECFLRAALHII